MSKDNSNQQQKREKELVYKFQHTELDQDKKVVRRIELVVMKPKGANSDPTRGYDAYINTLDADGNQNGPGVQGRYVPGRGNGPGLFSEIEYSKEFDSEGNDKTKKDFFPIAQLFLQKIKKDKTPIEKPFMSMNLITKEDSRPFKDMLDNLRLELDLQNEGLGLEGTDRVKISDIEGYQEYITLRKETFGKVTRERRALGMTVIVGHDLLKIPKPKPKSKKENAEKSEKSSEQESVEAKLPSSAPQADSMISSAEFPGFIKVQMGKTETGAAEATFSDLISQYSNKMRDEETNPDSIRRAVIKEVAGFQKANQIGTEESKFPNLTTDFLKKTINAVAPPLQQENSQKGMANG